jgi:acetyl esterase/lipase
MHKFFERMSLITARKKILFSALATLVLALSVGVFRSAADTTPVTEVFGTAADGTILHWDAYTPSTPGPWPAVLVIHGGGFNSGTPSSSDGSVTCAQDLAAAGYLALSIEYRLAPPGSLPGQTSDGRFPDQEDDVKLAVHTARADSRCNGQVGAVGGSAGGYHTAFVAATGTIGYDRIDVGVSLSGLYDASDFSPNPTLDYFTSAVLNYVNVASTNTAALRAASAAWLADKTIAPLFMVNTLEDPMPYSQLGDMIMHLDALGVTKYQVLTLTGSAHAFANWPAVKDQALLFLANGFAGVPLPPPLPSTSPGDASKKLLNVSTRADVGTSYGVMIGGFIVTGTTDKRVVLCAIGPSLTQFGVPGALADPILSLYDSAGVLVESNDNWTVIPGIPNPLQPSSPSESLLTAILPAGSYTAILQGAGNLAGIALVEAYDLTPVNSTVINISTRGDIVTPSDVIIGGFIVGGTDPTSVIVRALGPSLGPLGVPTPLPNPYLELHDSNGTLLFANDNWRSTQEQQIIATTIPPTDDLESAIVATLSPGSYTAVVRDANFATGIALVEVYDLEPQ